LYIKNKRLILNQTSICGIEEELLFENDDWGNSVLPTNQVIAINTVQILKYPNTGVYSVFGRNRH
jgi:hypothetical protein